MSTILASAVFRRAVPVVAMAFGLVALGLSLAEVPLDSLAHLAGTGGPVANTLATAGGTVPTVAVGTLLAARRPRNPIGWLALGTIVVTANPANPYLVLDYRMHHGTLPLGWAAVLLLETWPLFVAFLAIMLWLFPDGTLPAGRWRRPAAVAVAGGLLLAVAASSSGVVAVAGHHIQVKADGDIVNPPLGGLAHAVVVAGVVSWAAWLIVQVPSYRRADGVHRQQLTWLYSGAAITVVSVAVNSFIAPLVMGETLGYGTQPVVNDVTAVTTAALPVCVGVAIFRYRLYELNRIISRVVAYTLITALLAGLFFGLVLLATRVLPVRTPTAVAASTLVIAALFNPLRRRVQQLVDRRFNRSRYDAEAIVAAFNARLRQTVDLDTVRLDLLGVTENAFQPAHVSLWIAPAQQRPALAAEAGLSRLTAMSSVSARVGRLWHVVRVTTSQPAGGASAAATETARDRPSGAEDSVATCHLRIFTDRPARPRFRS